MHDAVHGHCTCSAMCAPLTACMTLSCYGAAPCGAKAPWQMCLPCMLPFGCPIQSTMRCLANASLPPMVSFGCPGQCNACCLTTCACHAWHCVAWGSKQHHAWQPHGVTGAHTALRGAANSIMRDKHMVSQEHTLRCRGRQGSVMRGKHIVSMEHTMRCLAPPCSAACAAVVTCASHAWYRLAAPYSAACDPMTTALHAVHGGACITMIPTSLAHQL